MRRTKGQILAAYDAAEAQVAQLKAKLEALAESWSERESTVQSLDRQLQAERARPCERCGKGRRKIARFPAWRYHVSEAPRLVQNAREAKKLSTAWREEPWMVTTPAMVTAKQRREEYRRSELGLDGATRTTTVFPDGVEVDILRRKTR